MNLSGEEKFFGIECNVAGTKFSELRKVTFGKMLVNQIFAILVNIILIILALILNVVPIITIWRSSQLRSKPCYFIILMQSVIDLAVGVLAIPLFVTFMISLLDKTSNCLLAILTLRGTVILITFSVFTIIAMTAERYIAILHPYAYPTLVTKKRLVKFVCSCIVVNSAVTVLSFSLDDRYVKIYASAITLISVIFIVFAYTRIYLVVRRLSRSERRAHDSSSEGNTTRRKVLLQEIKQAKSCFIVVICFFALCLFPVVAIQSVFKSLDKFENLAFFIWVFTLSLSVSIADSVIFFWTKKILRKEAVKILNTIGLCLSSNNHDTH
ncbi:adenosine receptor A2a-like [Dendronephthya gigantea]|uniref:adenosine receptor A2a-like n=1 Tax=Dendronephthya gigantea TaxID=151771 RepID=UPI00106C5E67|nr:adenosine receptor A2a-like [Dendronephthya gigantea]